MGSGRKLVWRDNCIITFESVLSGFIVNYFDSATQTKRGEVI